MLRDLPCGYKKLTFPFKSLIFQPILDQFWAILVSVGPVHFYFGIRSFMLH